MAVRRRDGPILATERVTSFQLMERVVDAWTHGSQLTLHDIPRCPRRVTDLDTAIIVLAHATIRYLKAEKQARNAKTAVESKAVIQNACFAVQIHMQKPERGSILAGVLRLLRKMFVIDIDEERRLIQKVWDKMKIEHQVIDDSLTLTGHSDLLSD